MKILSHIIVSFLHKWCVSSERWCSHICGQLICLWS